MLKRAQGFFQLLLLGAKPRPGAADALRPRQKPRYPEIHGQASEGCTWSENAARQLSVPERFGFRAWLRSRGFELD